MTTPEGGCAGRLWRPYPGSYLPSSGRHGNHSPGSPLALLPEKGQSSARLAGEAGCLPEKGRGLGGRVGRKALKKKVLISGFHLLPGVSEERLLSSRTARGITAPPEPRVPAQF